MIAISATQTMLGWMDDPMMSADVTCVCEETRTYLRLELFISQ